MPNLHKAYVLFPGREPLAGRVLVAGGWYSLKFTAQTRTLKGGAVEHTKALLRACELHRKFGGAKVVNVAAHYQITLQGADAATDLAAVLRGAAAGAPPFPAADFLRELPDGRRPPEWVLQLIAHPGLKPARKRAN